jgi:hypothetical protein
VVKWHSVHVYYYERDRSALILEGVRPLFERIADDVESAYWVPHWRRGPHLRLHVRADENTYSARVRPVVDEIIGAQLKAAPSQANLDPQALLPLHRRLAEVELDDGPLLPWVPDNTILDARFESRAEVLRSTDAFDLLTGFYADTNELTFAMTEHLRSGRGTPLGLAFDLLIATAQALSRGGVRGAFLSFRSHAEAFCNVTSDGQRLRPIWDDLYAKQSTTLTERVRTVVAAVDSRPPEITVPFVEDWVAALTPLKQRAGELMAQDRLPMTFPDQIAGRPGEPVLTELSPFHRDLEAHEQWWDEVRSASWFAQYRLVLNYTYLHLTRLGIQPVQRFLLCHLAANAIQDAYGVSVESVAGV